MISASNRQFLSLLASAIWDSLRTALGFKRFKVKCSMVRVRPDGTLHRFGIAFSRVMTRNTFNKFRNRFHYKRVLNGDMIVNFEVTEVEL